MGRLQRRATFRHLLQHPLQLILTVLGVALGVALMVAMDLAIQSSRTAFAISTETVAGRASHSLDGGAAGIPDSLPALLRVELGLRNVAPLVEGSGSSPAFPGRSLRILGIDPLQEGAVRPYLTGGSGGLDLTTLLTGTGGVVLQQSTASTAGLELGDSFLLELGSHGALLEVGGLLTVADPRLQEGLRDVVLMDISLAQELLAREGRLSRIDLRLPDGLPGEEAEEVVRANLPPGVRLLEAGAREATLAEMVRAFDLNLTALSLLALVFGMFLIYNTMTFSVVQRRRLLGTLRILGTTRGELVKGILAEAVLLGAVGTMLGLLLGVILGRGLVTLVTRTINDLYFVLSVDGLSLPPAVFLKGAVVGLGATLLASLPPALEAAGISPRDAMARSQMEAGVRRLVPMAAGVGVLALALGGGVLMLPGGGVGMGFAGLALVLLGVALLAPQATVLMVWGLRPILRGVLGMQGAMAARGVVVGLSRTAPAVAALVVAVAVTVGLGAMIGSFRTTVERWLDYTLQADLYVSPPSTVTARADGRLPPGLVAGSAALPGVDGLSSYRGEELLSDYGLIRLVALGLDPRGEGALRFLEGGEEETLRRFRREDVALVSEPFARRALLARGDSIVLPGDRGPVTLPVAGVFRDYGSGQGVVMLSRDTFGRFWLDEAGEVTSLAFFLAPGASIEAVADTIRGLAAAAGGEVVVRSNQLLRETSLEVFDRTFAITGVLRALAFIVAFIAVLSALMALQLERTREVALLRASGMTPGQLAGMVTTQTGLLGFISGLLALPAGVLLAVIMIFVVNRRSFGWTLEMHVGPEILLQSFALALAGSLLAGVYPIWRLSRTSPAEGLRGDGE
ncbi:MAG: FtsX-like permease family protein [Gemmatimonadota bacterium]